MPSEDTKILEFNQYQKSYKITSSVYADFESLIRKVDEPKNNSEKPSSKKQVIVFPADIQCLEYGHN